MCSGPIAACAWQGGGTRNASIGRPPVTAAALPPAPVDTAVNLRKYSYMPLDVVRLRDSGLAAEASAEGFRCAIILWCAAWHQIPAGSLPDNDAQLAKLAGFGRVKREFLKHKPDAMRGWSKHADGRLYHPVVTEKVLEAWQSWLRQCWDREKARIKKAAQRADSQPYYPTLEEWRQHFEATGSTEFPEPVCPRPVPGDNPARPGAVPGDIGSKGEERRGEETLTTSSNNPASVENSELATALALALEEIGYSNCSSRSPDVQLAAKQAVTVEELRAAAEGKVGKPVSYLVSRALGKRSDAAERGGGQPSTVVPIKPVDPAEAERKQQIETLENRIYDARHLCDTLGMIDAEERDKRIAALRDQQRELRQCAAAGAVS